MNEPEVFAVHEWPVDQYGDAEISRQRQEPFLG
jgi:hypothetical protein